MAACLWQIVHSELLLAPASPQGARVRRIVSLNCHSSGSLLAGIDNSQSREIIVLSWFFCELVLKTTSAHFGRIEAGRRLILFCFFLLPTGLLYFLGDIGP